MRVYNLTGALYALSNIALRRLKVSRYRDLNDPFELLGVNLADKRYRNVFRKMRDAIDKAEGIVCFSGDWKNPLLWGHYAEKHTGIALGFEIAEKELIQMEYKSKLSMPRLGPGSGQPKKAFIEELARTKFEDWHYEKEWRLRVPLKNCSEQGGTYFTPFSKTLALREVILGPKCNFQLREIQRVVNECEPTAKVIQSRIAFTRFEVLTNRAATSADRR